jgi:hypothetical protein
LNDSFRLSSGGITRAASVKKWRVKKQMTRYFRFCFWMNYEFESFALTRLRFGFAKIRAFRASRQGEENCRWPKPVFGCCTSPKSR